MIILKDKKNMTRFIVIFTLLFLIIASVYAAIEFSDGYQSCRIGNNQTWADLEAEYRVPADIIALFNNKSTTEPLKEGMRIKIPDRYTETIIVSTPKVQTAQVSAVESSGETTDLSKSQAPINVNANQVAGYVGTINIDGTEIRTQPQGKGDLLFDKTKKGMTMLVIGENATYYSVLMSDGSIGWVSKISMDVTTNQMVVDRPTAPTTTNSTFAQTLIDTAYKYLGVPYKYGGSLPNNVDCSLFVQTVFGTHNIRLPRTAAQQSAVGTKVEFANLQMGDRLYFYNPNSKYIGHTGIYISDGRFIHASSNRKQVAVDLLSSGNYMKNYAWAMR